MENQKVYKSLDRRDGNMLPGNLKGLPDESFFLQSDKETLVFIDSNFISKLSKHFGNGKYILYDLVIFSENLAKKQNLLCKKICYYTAPPFQSSIFTKEEQIKKVGYVKFIDKLRKMGVVVREGRCQRLKIDGKFEYKQKGVDILLAMDLMNIPLKFPQVKKAILIASDSDFVPIIESLREQEIKTILYTYYEKRRDTIFSRSNHLIKSVYKYVLLSYLLRIMKLNCNY